MRHTPGTTTRERLRLFALAAAVPFLFLVACGGDGEVSSTASRGAGVASPMIEGPVTGGLGQPFLGTTTFDLALVGYTQAEFFISGTAKAYANVGQLTSDGKWSVTPSDTAGYKTRILVYRPLDARKFNGTVFVEWLNVSGGVDAAADWIAAHTELVREGSAWVGVSAQIVGVEGGTTIFGQPASLNLKKVDPARYGSLVHPGDSFSYDIFSQAGQAIRRPSGPRPLGDLTAGKLIAGGDSQSAFRLVTYIDAVHPLDDMYDGFLVHSRGSLFTAALSEPPQASITVIGNSLIRDDLDVPVLTFETETDLSFLSYVPARQPDTDRFRLWEVAGTAHADTYTLSVGLTDVGDSPDAARLVVTTMPLAGIECTKPINSGPHHFVLDAAVAALNRWVVHGTLPPMADRLQANGALIRRDANGNALGGIRTPQVDVPIAALSGDPQFTSPLCLLFGTTQPFDEATLAALYPTHEDYVAAFDHATDRAVEAGFLLPPDAELMKAAAASSDTGD